MKKIAIIVSSIIIAIVLASYAFWVYKSKVIKDVIINIIEKNPEFSNNSVKVGGFPFRTIVFLDDVLLTSSAAIDGSKTTVNIKKVQISSPILSDRKFRITVSNDITIENDLYPERNSYIEFEETPYITFSLHEKGSLKNFSYEDRGYRVVDNEGHTVYSAGMSLVGLDSLVEGNEHTYRLALSFQDLKNFNVLNTPGNVSLENSLSPIMENDFVLDTIVFQVKEDNSFPTKTSVKINDLNFSNDLYGVFVTGNFISDLSDMFPSGKVLIKIEHINNFLNAVSKFGNNMMTSEAYNNVGRASENPYFGIEMKNVFKNLSPVLKGLAKKNTESNKNLAVFKMEREKGDSHYYINGQKIEDVVNELLKD